MAAAADYTLRRRIGAELAGIHDALQQSQLADPLTGSIRTWYNNFHNAYRASDRDQETLNIYLAQMRTLLHSPAAETPLDPSRILYNAPLDEDAVFGTDGNTYGEKALRIYLHVIQAPNRIKFPYQPTNATDFTLVAHPLAQHMIGWLGQHGQRDRNLDQETLYNTLRGRNELPPLPTVQSVRRDRYAQRRAQQQREAEEAEMAPLQEQLAQFRANNSAANRAQFAPLQQQINQNEVARNARVQGIQQEQAQFQQQNNAQLDAAQNRLTNINQQNNVLNQQIHIAQIEANNLANTQAGLQAGINAATQPPPKPKDKHRVVKILAGATLTAVGGVYIPF